MTLTLDEVRNTKFHMARRSGYEVTDVDLFVDRVEASFGQLVEENENLKREIESLRSGGGRDGSSAEPSPALTEENSSLRGRVADLEKQLAEARNRPAAQSADRSSGQPVAQVSGSGESLVVSTAADASPAVVRLVQLATEQAEQLVDEAQAESGRTVDDAKRQAHEITTDARTRAERIESEARVNADKLRGDAQSHADNLRTEVDGKRAEMFGQLETERDQLTDAVAKLRHFEKTYRDNLTGHLRNQLQQVESGEFEPDNAPGLVQRSEDGSGESSGEHQPGSSTPRLDALLGEQR